MSRKVFAVLVLFLAVSAGRLPDALNVTVWNSASLKCHPGLLESYALEPLSVPTSDKNYLCSGIVNNCCSLRSQLKIYRRLSSEQGAPRLARRYHSFLRDYQTIFKLFASAEDFAKTIRDALPPGATSNCGQLANRVLSVGASKLQSQVIASFQRAFRFLYDSHRGFYCSLCDSGSLKFIQPQEGVLRVSHGFCSSLVGETLGAMSFKHEYWPQITRLISQMMTSCTGAGAYNPRARIKRANLFFSRKRIIRDIKTCKDNVQGSSGIAYCSRYCERFNPARLSRTFEGQARRTSRFRRWLQSQLRGIVERASSTNNKEDLNFKGRILQAANSTANATAASNSTSAGSAANATTRASKRAPLPVSDVVRGIAQFNSNYSTQLVVPVSFAASELPKAKTRPMAQRESIFRLAPKPIFNVADFRTVVSKLGYNPQLYGWLLGLQSNVVATLEKKIADQAALATAPTSNTASKTAAQASNSTAAGKPANKTAGKPK